MINTYNYRFSEEGNLLWSDMFIKESKNLVLTIDLKELNSYLILFQLIFKFLNDINRMGQELADTTQEDES